MRPAADDNVKDFDSWLQQVQDGGAPEAPASPAVASPAPVTAPATPPAPAPTPVAAPAPAPVPPPAAPSTASSGIDYAALTYPTGRRLKGGWYLPAEKSQTGKPAWVAPGTEGAFPIPDDVGPGSGTKPKGKPGPKPKSVEQPAATPAPSTPVALVQAPTPAPQAAPAATPPPPTTPQPQAKRKPGPKPVVTQDAASIEELMGEVERLEGELATAKSRLKKKVDSMQAIFSKAMAKVSETAAS